MSGDLYDVVTDGLWLKVTLCLKMNLIKSQSVSIVQNHLVYIRI
jgi:hypothetical protein